MAKVSKRPKGQTTVYTTLYSKPMIEQHSSHLKPGVNACASEGLAVPVTPVTLVTSPMQGH